jgi:AraC-like DNA-binding protein
VTKSIQAKEHCLIVATDLTGQKVARILQRTCCTTIKDIGGNALYALTLDNYACLIIQLIEEEFESQKKELALIKMRFNNLPIITIPFNENLEVIRTIGNIGIDCVVSPSEIDGIAELYQKVLKKNSCRVTLTNFGIKLGNCTEKSVQALTFIEARYVELMNTSEIANSVNIAEATLSREFRKSGIVNPKRILMLFKIRHSINLMDNPALKLKDITYLSGFSNERRFNECFWRIMKCSPSQYRETRYSTMSIHSTNVVYENLDRKQ